MGPSLEEQVRDATPGQLIEMLYARAIRDLEEGEYLLKAADGRSAQAIHKIVHAQQIVSELNHCLNLCKGGKLAQGLARIYEYMQYRLTEAVSRREAKHVKEVLGLLTDLHKTWKTVAGEGGTGA